MKRFKRIAASVSARIDYVVRGIENHDAVVAASLQDLRRTLARARVRHNRVRAQREHQGRGVDELHAEADTWRERARASADDEDTALQCLRRGRRCQARAEQLAGTHAKLLDAERRLGVELERLGERYETLHAKRHSMRGRQAAAEAAQASAVVEWGDDTDLEEILDRWDIEITETELDAGARHDEDTLARGFDEAETLSSLRAELEELKRKEGARNEQ